MTKSISIFVHDLSSNPIARVVPFVKAFRDLGYDVQVLGFVFGGGEGVHIPYQGEVDPVVIETTKRPSELFTNIRRLARAANGDIVYAFKPLVTTLAPALYSARIVKNRPLLLDVEDEEVYLDQSWDLSAAWRKLFRGWRLGTSWKYTRLLQLFRGSADAVTVVSTELKSRYGGSIIRHGPDENDFSPVQYSEKEQQIREKWGLPQGRKLAMFTGTPRPHKGFDVLTKALLRSECKDWDFVLVGPNDNEFARQAKKELPQRAHFLGPQSYSKIPELLSVADAVPIPQKDTPFAEAQVPAKLLDAMAMARPIVASSTGDLPNILGEGRRGLLVPPGDERALAQGLMSIRENPEEAEERASYAREWYKRNASTRALAERIKKIVENVKADL
jgi:glycosyltransferase involved in cell wall biosynthesis